jgi:DNA processing protein
MNKELIYLIAFKKVENVGDKTLDKIYEKFNSFERAWYADDDEIRQLTLQRKIMISLLETRRIIDIEDTHNEIKRILSQGIQIATKFGGKPYPERLHELKDAPSVVYVKGTVKERDENALAIVGTREPSQMGKDHARTIARRLAESGCTIISGLAKGTDTQAHLGALDGNGRTIGVLGTGFCREVFYPRENFSLFNRIVNNGFCISEFPPEARGLGHRMYIRNRIISILSKGVLIVEMKNSPHSGTLAQAWYAKNQGRNVFVMEEIDAVSGNNKGWKILKRDVEPIIVKSYEDILDEIDRPLTKQINLLQYGVGTTE